ncbi:MAG: M24 family metallopeptidase [Bacillota bacterium]
MLKLEISERIKNLQQELTNQRLDCYIVASEDNIWYLSGITYKPEERPFFILITPGEKPVLIVPKLEERHLKKVIIDCEIMTYWDYPSPAGNNWYDILEKAIRGFTRIGVEENIKSNILKKICIGETIQTDLLNNLRKVKSPFEIEMIRRTAKISDEAMGRIKKSAYYGASVVEMFSLSKSIQKELIKNKEFDPVTTSLLTAVWPAPVSSMPHSIPDLSDRLNKGPNVAMCYFRINGYAAECERTFFIGKPSTEVREHFNHMINARKSALSVLKAGAKCSDVDYEAKNYLVKSGYINNLLHRTGHGIGLGNHEEPWIALGNEEVLKENMVISIEPGIYIEELGGYRHSDTILITKDGYQFLTNYPSGIEDMIISGSNIPARIKGYIMRKILKL